MRAVFIAVVGVLGMTFAGAANAQPYDNYPVCLRVFGPATYSECRYTSIPQCKATASGRSAECYVNPYFANADGPNRRGGRRPIYR